MTTEARQEARELIFHNLEGAGGIYADEPTDKLVEALAAARRAEDAHGVYEDMRMDGAGDMAQGDALDELRGALSDLSEALSALREDET